MRAQGEVLSQEGAPPLREGDNVRKIRLPAFFDDPNRQCVGSDSETFFPPEVQPMFGKRWDAQPAKAICRKCPFMDECRDYAIGNNIQFGVWGGLTPRERVNWQKYHRDEEEAAS